MTQGDPVPPLGDVKSPELEGKSKEGFEQLENIVRHSRVAICEEISLVQREVVDVQIAKLIDVLETPKPK